MDNMDNNKLEPGEIDLKKYFKILWEDRKELLIWILAGCVIGLIIALCIPKTYTAKIMLAPETEQKMGGMSSLASMMGINIDNGTDALNIQMFPDIVKSQPYLTGLLKTPISTKQGLETDLFTYITEYQKVPWWTSVISLPSKLIHLLKSRKNTGDEINLDSLDLSNLPGKVRSATKMVHNGINVVVDKKSGKTNLSITAQDPYAAKQIAEAVVENLREYMTMYRTSKASQDVENLTKIYAMRKADYYKAQEAYARYMDSNKNITMKSAMAESERLQQEMNLAYQVYSQVATQLEASRIKEQTSKPFFVVVDPASVPLRESAPDKMNYILGFAALALIADSLRILLRKRKENDEGSDKEIS